MRLKKLHILLIIFTVTLVIIFTVLSAWMYNLDNIVMTRLEGRRFLPPVEYYSAPFRIFPGQKLERTQLIDFLKRLRYQERVVEKGLSPGEFGFLSALACQENLSEDLPTDTEYCVLINKFSSSEDSNRNFQLLAYGADNFVFQVYADEPFARQNYIELDEVLFAQFYGEEPIIRNVVELGEIPSACINAVIAIEDPEFLEHKGFSITGIARAIYKNLSHAKFTQGGSTITQQLIKNYFLTPEKTLKRKFTEIAMAILLESHSTKDDIIETYLNEIYMGQNGSFQIRGFATAANYYFSKDISKLNIPECALLAAVLNSPGLYNPFSKTDNAIKRRSLVLSKMQELNFISADEFVIAERQTLPTAPQKVLSEPAPFFVDSVRREIQKMGVDTSQGLKIYTTLDLRAQEAAQVAVRQGVEKLENAFKQIKDIKAQGKLLESSLISADLQTGEIQAIVGGRNFRTSQFNRTVQSRRQVGSIFKPIVYLTALQRGFEGEMPQPLTLISDDKFNIKYDKQEWSPINYDKKYYGVVPMYFALKNSLNVATAALALKVGMDPIVEVAHDLGIESDLRPVPALSLGAFELTPHEVLQVYSTIARMGEKINLTIIRRIEQLNGDVIFINDKETIRVANEEDTAILIGMMKQSLVNGTAASVRLLGFDNPAAGKTGTTSDTKDAWFAGFTPYHAAIVWVGYDDNTAHGLTGATGAVPIWTDYMKKAAAQYPALDFQWPEGVVETKIDVDTQKALGVPEEEKKKPLIPIHLIFKKGTEPAPSVYTPPESGI